MNKQSQWLFEVPTQPKTKPPKETPTAEYPLAEWVPAGNFRKVLTKQGKPCKRPRPILCIVIHITASPSLESTVNTFKNPKSGVSAHYVVGRDGKIVQMVRNNDIAFHAGIANNASIGIEHVACVEGAKGCKANEPPTLTQYCSSADLVYWLCRKYSLPIDRQHIVGHHEIDPCTDHQCPLPLWDWRYYMSIIPCTPPSIYV